MTALSEINTTELRWKFPRSPDEPFELYAAGARVGSLGFDDAFSPHAVGELDGRRWIFDCHCGANPAVSIVIAATATPVAEYIPRPTGGGTVQFTGGTRYCWNRAKIWSSQWCFRREGHASNCVSQQAGPLTEGGKVTVCADAAQKPETAILVLLAWYLRVLAFETLVDEIPTVG